MQANISHFQLNLVDLNFVCLCEQHVCTNAQRGQKWGLILLELELRVFLSHLTWRLRTELGSFERTLNTLNH